MHPGGNSWLGVLGAQWLCGCAALFVGALLTESFLGHYRSGFAVRMQYSPFVVGGALFLVLLGAAIAPRSPWLRTALRLAGWASIGLSGIGVGYHFYFGFLEKPGGLRWWLHHLMHHAPILAPFGLAIAGTVALIAGASLRATAVLGLIAPSGAVAIVVIFTLIGLGLQVFIYHYRGAFRNPVMYAPLVVAVATAAAAIWRLSAPSPAAARIYQGALWIAFLLGFIGWGWHLRGLDRMMGGLYVALPNVLEGPPLASPLLFSLLAIQGLIGERLL